jgi:hypothetical protein
LDPAYLQFEIEKSENCVGDVSKLSGLAGLFIKNASFFEIFVRGDDMKDMYGLHYMSGGEWDVEGSNLHQYMFEVNDSKKWVLARLKHGV